MRLKMRSCLALSISVAPSVFASACFPGYVTRTSEQDAGAPDATTADARGADADAAAPDAVSDRATPSDADAARDGESDGSPNCTSGGVCTLGECQTGTLACDGGVSFCQESAYNADGSACEVGGDSGAHVCSGGQCVACNAGGDCSDPGTCVTKAYDCSSGTAVCTVTGNVTNGVACGDAGLQFCNGGVCSACQVGAACAPTSNPCHVGKVTACTNGLPTCTDQQTNASAGTTCPGANPSVCDGAGNCLACSPQSQCTPSGSTCQSGTESCSSGPQCTNLASVNEGQPCGTTAGDICHDGQCVACSSSSCPSGCCGAAGCVPFSSQSITECGAGGGTCGNCPGPTSGTGTPTCASGVCGLACTTAGDTLCSTSCTNTSSDGSNCGTCGHSCLGGMCMSGKCQPVTIASPVYLPMALAATSTALYWASAENFQGISSEGSVGMAPLGGGNVTIIASAQNVPIGIGVNASGVFWINAGSSGGGGVMLLAPGATNPTALATAYVSPIAMALTSTNLYWIDDSSFVGQAENLLALPMSNLSATPTVAPASSGTSNGVTCGIAVAVPNTTNLVFIDTGCFAASGEAETVTLSPLGSPTNLLPSGTFLSGPYSEARIAVDSNNVYFGSSATGPFQIQSVPLTGGPLTVRATGQYINGVAVDSNNIYWTDNGTGDTCPTNSNPAGTAGTGSILSVPLTGGTVTTLASGQDCPYDILVTSTAIYWTNDFVPGSIMMLAK